MFLHSSMTNINYSANLFCHQMPSNLLKAELTLRCVTRSLYYVAVNPSVVCLSVACNVPAPYSAR